MRSTENVSPYQLRTRQESVSRELIPLLEKYRTRPFLRPIPVHQMQAFGKIKEFIGSQSSLILDSCSGTGLSTRNLALMHPHHGVIGIDKSEARLKRCPPLPSNALLVRGDVIDMWRLFAEHNVRFEKHFMFYPNPWPKIGHLKRRFYAHPSFLSMLSLSPHFELRSNWNIFIDEAQLACEHFGFDVKVASYNPTPPISLFEKKYQETQCPVFQLIAQK